MRVNERDAISAHPKDHVRVMFDGPFLPLESVDLNKTGQWTHHLEGFEDSDKVVYGVTVKGMQKVLTVRTPFLLINHTYFVYRVRIFHSVNYVDTHELLPGDVLPLPRLLQRYKIAFAINRGKSAGLFSDYIRIEKLL